MRDDLPAGGAWATFRSDLGTSLAVWAREPGLVLWTLALAVAIEVPTAAGRQPHARGLGVLAFPFELVMAGWVGTQRIWYLRAFRGQKMRPREPAQLTRAFTGRFVALDLIVGLPLSVVLGPLILARPAGWVVYIALVTLVLDVVATFVTPALAYTTSDPFEALGIGWRMLRGEWPHCAWYALTPALAILLINRAVPRSVLGVVPAALVGIAAWMLNLWFKGATAAYYLRGHQVGDRGSARR